MDNPFSFSIRRLEKGNAVLFGFWAHLKVRLGATAVAEGAVRAQSVALGTCSKGESKNNSFMRGRNKRLELFLICVRVW